MSTLLGFGINVLLLGALYALIAMGFTLIFGVGGVLNLAHGANIALGAYAAILATDLGAGIWVAALIALLVPGLFSLLLYLVLIRPVQDSPVTVLILTLVAGLIVEQVLLAVYGAQPIAVSNLVEGQISVAGKAVSTNRVLVFSLAWLLIGALFFFVTRTRAGKAVLATSMSKRGAALVGIRAERMYVYVWTLAGVLAGVAGLFLASFQTANPLMGRSPLLLSFAIVVLGGLGSIRGSLVGAYLIAFLDQGMVSFVSPRLSGLAGLVVLVLVLLARPEGLFGRELAE